MFLSYLYVYDTRPCHWSFLEGHHDSWSTRLSYSHCVRGVTPPLTTLPFYILFIRSYDWTIYCPSFVLGLSRLLAKPKVQYLSWAFIPTPTNTITSLATIYTLPQPRLQPIQPNQKYLPLKHPPTAAHNHQNLSLTTNSTHTKLPIIETPINNNPQPPKLIPNHQLNPTKNTHHWNDPPLVTHNHQFKPQLAMELWSNPNKTLT